MLLSQGRRASVVCIISQSQTIKNLRIVLNPFWDTHRLQYLISLLYFVSHRPRYTKLLGASDTEIHIPLFFGLWQQWQYAVNWSSAEMPLKGRVHSSLSQYSICFIKPIILCVWVGGCILCFSTSELGLLLLTSKDFTRSHVRTCPLTCISAIQLPSVALPFG